MGKLIFLLPKNYFAISTGRTIPDFTYMRILSIFHIELRRSQHNKFINFPLMTLHFILLI